MGDEESCRIFQVAFSETGTKLFRSRQRKYIGRVQTCASQTKGAGNFSFLYAF